MLCLGIYLLYFDVLETSSNFYYAQWGLGIIGYKWILQLSRKEFNFDYIGLKKWIIFSRTADSYNAAAFVNLGNCSFKKGDVEKAKELYQVALENDASCVEALYNAGLCNKKLGLYEEALEDFFKLHSIVRNHSEVVYQIASLYEAMGDVDQAIEWYE